MTPRDVKGVLDWCAKRAIPVGVNIDVAIDAHKQRPDSFTLRTVLLARTAETEESQRQLDYLASLPVDAWPDMPRTAAIADMPAEQVRAETIAALARNLTWQRSCG